MWIVSIADSIVNAVITFFAIILLLWTAAMADILQDENGQKRSEGHYKKNRLEGKLTEWYENGQIMEENYYKNGELKDWKITKIPNSKGYCRF